MNPNATRSILQSKSDECFIQIDGWNFWCVYDGVGNSIYGQHFASGITTKPSLVCKTIFNIDNPLPQFTKACPSLYAVAFKLKIIGLGHVLGALKTCQMGGWVVVGVTGYNNVMF